MTENGSTSLRALNISKCTAQSCEKIGNRISSKRANGLSALRAARSSIRAHSCAAVQSWDKTAASVRKQFWKTQFCCRMQKLLPKAGWRLVLSATEQRSLAYIATYTSEFMRTDLLVRRTRKHFPRLDVGEIKIAPIQKGGSDRKFYRIRCSAEQALILVKYNLEREENRHYVTIANFLTEHRIRVPEIYFHDADEGLIWLEDLGERDLYSYRDESWLVRRAFYESALDQIAALHALPDSVCLEMKQHLPAEFNSELYLWEQNYLFENCLGRLFKIEKEKLAQLASLPALQEIADRLASFPRVLVHRDFQSQNIIIRNGQAYLIDFQGMRHGLAEYDLASLLYDPYVDLPESERAELTAYYREHQLENGIAINGDFDLKLRLCAMHRLMQALGAYGFLGLVKGHKHFLEYIPNALRSLRAAVAKIDNLQPLASFLGDL